MVMRIRTALLTAVLCLVPAASAFGAGGGGSSGFGGGGGRRGGGAGGLVGGGIDGFMMKKIADHAMKEFPAV